VVLAILITPLPSLIWSIAASVRSRYNADYGYGLS
jgi:hypothetical protein